MDFAAPDPGGDFWDDIDLGHSAEGNQQRAAIVEDQDEWQVQGDALVRVYRRPRTTLFSPTECPDDLPPVDLVHLDAMRTTSPVFAGGLKWPELECIEDAWCGHAQHDAKTLRDPGDGSTLTWTERLSSCVSCQSPSQAQDGFMERQNLYAPRRDPEYHRMFTLKSGI